MPRYIIETEQQNIPPSAFGPGKENWHASVTDGYGGGLIDRDGDTESEAITICMTELLGNLPADFPPELIGAAR